ncbi:nicotinate-nucleotide adenylyltransferase, partial [Omnitrophica bacterium]|nr:nicotinate-nucleotide adenylyltransferase [Candidatus Omnitrophota bacterium]
MKIGILGGTFNPIHLGHLRLAEEALKKLSLDKLIFIPSYIPPHKPHEDIVSSAHRLRMVEIAVEEKPNLEVSDIEIKLKGTSYSINTIKKLKNIYGDGADIYFIAGSDYADELESWKDIENLKRLCRFVIATRPGYNPASRPAHTEVMDVDTPDISSTNIRRHIKEGKAFKELLP